MKYSAKLNAFFDDMHYFMGNKPEDLVEVPMDLYHKVFENQSMGRSIIPGEDGLPTNKPEV